MIVKNISFRNSLQWPCYIINSVDRTKLFWRLFNLQLSLLFVIPNKICVNRSQSIEGLAVACQPYFHHSFALPRLCINFFTCLVSTMLYLCCLLSRHYMENKEWWNSKMEEEWKREARQQVMAAFSRAEKALKPPVEEMFSDVYDTLPSRLKKQYKECMDHVAKYPHEYPTELYQPDKWYNRLRCNL